ncbi:Crp/Fnr family transcriptional regulator [candidate division KSB1 bacterium]|nr:Crp/Fnr family transcriptional regulator [candidate division KSB1 bacterium]
MIEATASMRTIQPGELLFSEGQRATAFFILVNGQVKIYKLSDDGNEHILHVHQAGDLLAEAAIFDRETYPAFCQALETATLIRISRESFKQLLLHNPEIALKILSGYSRRLRQFVATIEGLALHDIKSRLAQFLSAHCRFENQQYMYQLTLSKKDLAFLLGTIPETLSRTLQFFKKEKVLIEIGNQIMITDPARLKSFI